MPAAAFRTYGERNIRVLTQLQRICGVVVVICVFMAGGHCTNHYFVWEECYDRGGVPVVYHLCTPCIESELIFCLVISSLYRRIHIEWKKALPYI